MKSIRLECFLPYIGILLFITRSQCPHCSNFILRSNFLRFASLCSQSAPQNAIESHWLSSLFSAQFHFVHCPAERYRSPQDFFLFSALLHSVRNLLRRTLSKSTGLLHASLSGLATGKPLHALKKTDTGCFIHVYNLAQ